MLGCLIRYNANVNANAFKTKKRISEVNTGFRYLLTGVLKFLAKEGG